MIYSGAFNGVKAILFGDFMADLNDPPSFVQWILDRLATEVKVPIFRINGLGHDTTNHPIPFNIPVVITHESDLKYTLTVNFLRHNKMLKELKCLHSRRRGFV